MKFKIPNKFHVLLSKKYLDWAEILPKFGGGFIHELQVIREHQRRASDKLYNVTKPPEGTELKYQSFRMIEIFHIEEFDKLHDGLLRLFPELQGDVLNQDFSTSFKGFSENITGGGWKSIGSISREKGNSLYFGPCRIIHKLPPEVDYIEVSMHKTLPSTIFITFDVHLTDLATQNLLRLQRSHYLSNVKFNSLIPWNMMKRYSMESEQTIMTQQIKRWSTSLRIALEHCIEPYLKGYFMRQKTKQSRLPVIDVYGIKGMPVEEKAFEEWRKHSWGWWDSFGFRFHSDIYSEVC